MSKLPPLWKIWREISRIGRQFLGLAGNLYTYYFMSYVYDAFYSKDVRTHSGSIGLKKKVAVYVIYPKNGLLKSHEESLDYIIGQGYSPLVVSNLPFESDDKDKVLSKCWACIERPNIGYDFGAYREGILHLQDRLSQLERIALINDSSWFPVGLGPNWVKEAEALNVDYAAAASSQGTPRAKTDQLFEGEWSFNQNHRNFHYGSFAVIIGDVVLKHRKFYRFWKRFPMTAEKNRTVRRGEIGLTKFIVRNGFTHGATFRMEELKTDLEALPYEQLLKVARETITFGDPRLAMLKERVFESEDVDRDKLLRLILTCVSRIGASYCFPDYAINNKGFSFMKKSPLHIDPESSEIVLDVIKTLPQEQRDYIYPEALDIAKNVKNP